MDNNITIENNVDMLKTDSESSPSTVLSKKAISSTLSLLDIEEVDYMIYVDDKFDELGQREEFRARLTKLKVDSNPIISDNFQNVNWEAPDPKFDQEINELWELSTNKQELLSEICRHYPDEDSANIIPVLEIKNYFGERIILMTPDEWFKDDYKIILALGEGKKALCLFDYEFQSGNTLIEGRNGAQLAKALIEKAEVSNKIICGIFSHKFSENDEEEYRNKYVVDYLIDKKKFYTISKNRYAFDPHISGFAEGIKNLLLHPHVEELKEKSLVVLKKSNEKASDRIDAISPSTFNQVIQKSSLKEGIWEVSTLFRLYGILSKEENFNMISDPLERQSFNNSIQKIRQIDLIDSGYNAITKNEQLTSLRNSELYIKSDIINKLHLPLTNGDVFEIKGKEYILLVQPCNLALRAKDENCGKRDYNYDVGMLIPLKYIAKDKLNITTEEIKIAESSDKFYAAYFPGFQIISLNFLDLSIFNDDGKALLNFNTSCLENELIHFPWLKRYEYIHKSLLPFEKKIVEFNTLKKIITANITAKQQLLKVTEEPEKAKIKEEIRVLKEHLSNTEKNIFNLEDLRKFKIDCTKIYNTQSRVFDTTIKRVRHYKSPYSDDLLQKFMLYLSRNAFEHDFTS